ncbi:MAG: diguanylate cyclase [Gammaproteobacteria bacterium]
MFDISHEELQAAHQQLEQAIYNHEQWYKDLIRSVVCRLPHDHRDLAKDAHHHCRFGQWYYGNSPEALHHHPAFMAMEAEHERMHKLAARLLIAAEETTPIDTALYDNFANSLERLRLQIYSLNREIRDFLYNRDSLTGAESRLAMLAKLREVHELAKRNVQKSCIVVMDLDHFKEINDSYGHVIGDRVLVATVNYLKANLRPYDTIYRYGGEEFLISMPSTDIQTCFKVVERLREGLAVTTMAESSQQPIFMTASFGIVELESDTSVEESIDRADKAMYASKTSGRNQSRIWDPSMTMPSTRP